MSKLAILKEFFLKNLHRYLLGILFLLFVDALQLVTPKLIGEIADSLKAGTITFGRITLYAGSIIGIALLVAIGRFSWRMYLMGTARRLDFYLRNKLFLKLQTLSVEYFHRHKTGDLMAHATNDIQAIRMAFGQGIVLLVDILFLTGMTLLILLTISPRLTMMALTPFPFLLAVILGFGKQLQYRFKAVQEAFSRLTDKAQENLTGIRVIKSFVQEEAEIEAFKQESLNNVQKNMRLVRIWGVFFPLMGLIATFAFIIVIWFGGVQVVNNTITLGDFIAFLSYLNLLIWPMTAIGWLINIIQRGTVSLQRLDKIFREIPGVVDPVETAPIGRLEGNLEISNLTFTYPGADKPVLKGVNLTLKKGRTLALVGKTGSGKTTLVSLLLRLYNPPPGSILMDGIDLNKIPLKTLRQAIGYVPQDNFLFSTTIHENIGFAGESFSDQAIEEVAKQAQIYESIVDFPEKFQTVVGERGTTLSGGQKQRISIARALIKNPALLILDDCFSAVDTQTEEKILTGLRSYLSGRTGIIISHRISTVQEADEIVLLDHGEIIERGDHHTLLQLKGRYWEMYQKQRLEEELASVE